MRYYWLKNPTINLEILVNEQQSEGEGETKTEEPTNPDLEENKVEGGLQQFSFHITLLLLLIVMAAVNVGLTIAWIKSKQ